MKLSLNFYEQVNLLNAFASLDSYKSTISSVEGPSEILRVPYKLGSKRKILVKNLVTLNAKVAEAEETRKDIFRESFPNVPEGTSVQQADDPEAFANYVAAVEKSRQDKDEVELLTFGEDDIYNDNDFPSASILTLSEAGLIVETA